MRCVFSTHTDMDITEALLRGEARKQYIRDMKWVGKHIARQANWKGEDIIIVVIPLREWQEIGSKYPIYHEMSKENKC